MRNQLVALLLIVTPLSALMAQEKPAPQQGVKVSSTSTHPEGEPLYIISSDDKELEFVTEKEEDTKSFFSILLPEWIESVSVMHSEDAVSKFGIRGKYGAVLIALEEGSLQKFPEEWQKRFSKTKS